MPINLHTHECRTPRVVLDNNIVISALVFGGGAAARVRQAWQHWRCQPMVSEATTFDLMMRLAHPSLGFSRREQHTLLGDFLPYALRIGIPRTSRPGWAPEPQGMPFARLAMAGKAHALVVSDTQLLALAGHFVCPVMTLDHFAAALLPQQHWSGKLLAA